LHCHSDSKIANKTTLILERQQPSRRSQRRVDLRRSACNAQIWKSIYTEEERVPQRRVDFKNQML